MIEDMSRNGTFINGQSMERGSRQVLKNGDHIQLYRRAAFEETDPRQQCKLKGRLFFQFPLAIDMRFHLSFLVYKIVLAPNLDVPVCTTYMFVKSTLIRSNTTHVASQTFEENYELGRVLGEGNFAKVHSAIERETGREFAVKIMQKRRFAGKPKLLASLRKEIAVLMGLPKHVSRIEMGSVYALSYIMTCANYVRLPV